jgi:hypothetical protein
VDALGANTGVGGLAALLEGSVQREDKSEFGPQKNILRLHLQISNHFHAITTVTIPLDGQATSFVQHENGRK